LSIRKLPQNIIDQIAAGEVITRPVNIVKELVENSIDASAKHITIIIEDGGKKRLTVKDDGHGIPKDELALAFELHSSSKIQENNIYNVSTLGFRGEALASITAVSKVKCKSRSSDQEMGRQIVIEASEVKKIKDITMRRVGTEIEVVGIFYSIPARRKFLGSAAIEKKAIVDLVQHLALTYYNLQIELFEVKNNKQITILQSPAREEQLSAIFDILGEKIARNLVKVEGLAGRWKISGYISSPIICRKDRSLQYISVNGRAIKQKEIQKTIEESYGSQLLKRTYPIVVLDIQGESQWVDYNIHPQKAEIRFSSDDPILDELSVLIKNSLSKGSDLPSFQGNQKFDARPENSSIKEMKKEKIKPLKGGAEKAKLERQSASSIDTIRSNEEPPDLENSKQMILDEFSGRRAERSIQGYKVLGQIMKKFAIIDAGSELWLMDLHASDERVKFEAYEAHSSQMIMSQQLLSPMAIEVSPEILDLVEEQRQIFSKFGMEVSISRSKILIHSVPTYFDQKLSEKSILSFFEDVLLSVQGSDEANVIETPLNELQYYIVSRLACHGSIRSGYFVDTNTILHVLEELLKCKNPWTCAHGRPTILRFNHSTLEGWFKRSG